MIIINMRYEEDEQQGGEYNILQVKVDGVWLWCDFFGLLLPLLLCSNIFYSSFHIREYFFFVLLLTYYLYCYYEEEGYILLLHYRTTI